MFISKDKKIKSILKSELKKRKMFISAFCFHVNQAWQGAYCPTPVLFQSLQTGVRYLDIEAGCPLCISGTLGGLLPLSFLIPDKLEDSGCRGVLLL